MPANNWSKNYFRTIRERYEIVHSIFEKAAIVGGFSLAVAATTLMVGAPLIAGYDIMNIKSVRYYKEHPEENYSVTDTRTPLMRLEEKLLPNKINERQSDIFSLSGGIALAGLGLLVIGIAGQVGCEERFNNWEKKRREALRKEGKRVNLEGFNTIH